MSVEKATAGVHANDNTLPQPASNRNTTMTALNILLACLGPIVYYCFTMYCLKNKIFKEWTKLFVYTLFWLKDFGYTLVASFALFLITFASTKLWCLILCTVLNAIALVWSAISFYKLDYTYKLFFAVPHALFVLTWLWTMFSIAVLHFKPSFARRVLAMMPENAEPAPAPASTEPPSKV